MSDEPAFEAVSADFGMELADESVAPETDRLVRADLGRGETLGHIRQVERVAMPMQDRCAGQMTQRSGPANFAECLNLNRVSCIYASRLWYSVQANLLTSRRTEAM